MLADRRRREPAVADEVIEAPIIVTGPARSGTTIVFELLGLDPGVRTPIATDVIHPVPPAGTTAVERTAMTPAYVFMLDDLLAAYPDATIILTLET